jgi:type II secretory pathway component PulF
MKKNHELTSRIKGALMYPAVIVVAMIGISIEVVVFIVFDD